MARMISEGEKRAKRGNAIRARRVQQLEGRGYSTNDAKTVVSSVAEATLLAEAGRLARGLGIGSSANLEATDRMALGAIENAFRVVAKNEPRRAAAIERILSQARDLAS